MGNETCPHCGAEPLEAPGEWACGTSKYGDRVRMSDHCETRQNLATVTAERDELRRRLTEAPVAKAWIDSDGGIASVKFVQIGGHPFVNPAPIRVRLVRDEQPGD